MAEEQTHIVAVLGAGPAGLFAARLLAEQGVRVVLFNRDIKPGGLAEYGIYHTKYKMKSGLRRQFSKILDEPLLDYYGNVTIGEEADFTLAEIEAMGFDAVLVTVGAQGTKWLGLPGEELTGVYHAKDLVYFYNKLPPYSEQDFPIGQRMIVIGVGNVMLDMAHWGVRDLKIDEVTAVARRGPAEVKFTRKEMEIIFNNLDMAAFEAEMERCRPIMEAVGQDVADAKKFILSAQRRAKAPVSDTTFGFQFFSTPKRIVGDENGNVIGLEVEDTILKPRDGGGTSARGVGTFRVIPAETVVFAIGDKVDEQFGLPIEWNEFVKNPEPRFPIDGASYEAFHPQNGHMEKIFVAGWSRQASDGLVGAARKDGEKGAEAVLAYLQTQNATTNVSAVLETVQAQLATLGGQVIDKTAVAKLEAIEAEKAKADDLPEYKFSSNAAMLAAIQDK